MLVRESVLLMPGCLILVHEFLLLVYDHVALIRQCLVLVHERLILTHDSLSSQLRDSAGHQIMK